MFLIFCTECTESLLDILPYPESTIGPPWLGLEKIFKKEHPQKAGKRYFVIDLCIHSECFLQLYVLSTAFQALCSLQFFKN